VVLPPVFLLFFVDEFLVSVILCILSLLVVFIISLEEDSSEELISW
jgi:VIT1/CCC1 family predicted Fe2+/Mn2+ transporter